LTPHSGGDVRNFPVGKLLAYYKKAGELHVATILTPCASGAGA
jgi:hypothetical protein